MPPEEEKNHDGVAVDIKTESRYHINRKAMRDVIFRILKKNLWVESAVWLEIIICGNRRMRALNKKFRALDETADVLSFPLQGDKPFIEAPDNVLRLGTIVISYPQAVAAAGDKETLVDEEINFLVEHGLWHLLGRHHD